MNKLDKYRREIDKINSEIIKLIAARIKVCKKVGEYKKNNGKKVYDKKREREIFKKLDKECGKRRLDKKFVNKIFKMIIKESKKVQK